MNYYRDSEQERKFEDIGVKFMQRYRLDGVNQAAGLEALKHFVANTKQVAAELGIDIMDAFFFQRRLCYRWLSN
ncbi:MAG: hypothetical protein V4474_00760 [Patescibacteria group bacterium]